jgi:hypothetical protein
MATPEETSDAYLRLLVVEAEAAQLARIMAHANLTVAILNDKHGPSNRSVAAASKEATEIMQASALAVSRPDFWGAAS